MRRSYLLSFVALLTIVFGGGINAAMANAAAAVSNGAANGFTISPVLTEISVAKGQSQTIALTVSNPTSTSLTAVPIVNDFVASNDESGTPRLILNSSVPLPADNFESLVGNIPTVTLGPDQSQTINVTVNVPKDAFSGGYYGAIRFVPGTLGKQSNVGLTASVGSLFLVTVPGNLTEKLSLVQLSAADRNGNPSSFFTNGQLSALVRLDNTGNIYTQPFGTIELKNTFGHIISVTQFNNSVPRSSILQQSIRKFVVSLPSHSYIGHYTMIASFGYGTTGSGNLIVAQTGFWYIPIWAQIVGLVIVVVIITIVYWIVHTVRSRRFSRR